MSVRAAEERVLGGVRALLWRGTGRGRLLLLHGFLGHPRAWQEVVDRLPEPGLVVAPFVPGHGPEPVLPAWRSFEDVVAALAAVVRVLQPGPWRLAGYSLGARLGLGLLAAAPQLWSRALLVGVNPGLGSERERTARRAEDAGRARMLRERGLEAFVKAWEEQPLFASQRSLSPSALAAQRRWRLSHHPERLAWALETLSPGAMPDYWPALASIRVAVQLVAGELDRRFCEFAGRAARLLAAGQFTVVPKVGHNVVLEAPEAIVRLLEMAPPFHDARREEGS